MQGRRRVALDISSLLVLCAAERLQEALDYFEEVFVSPRVMEVLLEEREKVLFHQPSRVAEVKPLMAFFAQGRLTSLDLKGRDVLVREVGEESASLLLAASTRDGLYVHSGKLFKVRTFMEEEAQLGEYARYVVDTVDVAASLRDEAVITSSACDAAIEHLHLTGASARQAIPKGVPVFLDGLAVQYLQQTGLLQPLLNSTHKVFVHKSTIEEWQALLGTEPMAAQQVSFLDGLRTTLRGQLLRGKLKFLQQSRRESRKPSATTMLPLEDLLSDSAGVEAAVIDDRMLGLNLSFVDSAGRSVPILSSLDVIDGLSDAGLLNAEKRRETLHHLRAGCYFCIPIDASELRVYLDASTLSDGVLRESAELRVIRQYLARLHASNVLCTQSDLEYQDSLYRAGSYTIAKLWLDPDVSVAEAVGKSNWVAEHFIPDPVVAMRFSEGTENRLSQLVAAQLTESMSVALKDSERRRAYKDWLDSTKVRSLLPANAAVIDLAAAQLSAIILERTRKLVDELRSANCTPASE